MVTEGAARKPDWVGRGVGLAVFTGGIVLLIVVFVWTNQQLAEFMPMQGKVVEITDGVRFGVAVARLFISGLIASWIAGRGAQMYAAASRALHGE